MQTGNYRISLKMIKDKACIEKIRSINDKYLYWDKVKYQEIPENYSPEDLWAATKLTRQLVSKHFEFGRYTFSFCLTDYIHEVLHEFDLNMGGNLGAQKLIPEEDKDKYLVSSIMEEAIASSQMEGAVTTRKKAKEMLRKNIRPRSKSEQMILNNYRSIQHIVKNKSVPIDMDQFLLIHKLMANNTLDHKSDEGALRKSNDIFVVNHMESEIVHTPPDYRELPGLLEQVFAFFNEDPHNFFIHPVIKGIVIHFMIAWIHPFVDGNGRTARALFYWYLLSKGYWLTEYLSISRLIVKSKNQYERAFLYTENDANDLSYFLTYNLKTMSLAYEALNQYIRRKLEEKKALIRFQRLPFVNERQAEILKWFYDEPDRVTTVKEVENRFLVSNQTARTDLLLLVKRGFLEIIQANKKKQNFIRHPDFDKILKTYLS